MSSISQTHDGKMLIASISVLTLLLLGMIGFAGLRLYEQAYYLGDLPDTQSLAALQQNNVVIAALIAAAVLLVLSVALTLVTLRRQRAAQAERLKAEVERQIAESTVRLNQEVSRFKAILDGMQDGVIYSEDHQIRYANRTLIRMIGYDGHESDEDTHNRLAGLHHSLSSLIGQNGKSQGVFTIRRKDGSEFEARVTHVHLNAPVGGVLTIVQDNSAERTLQTQKMRFVSIASHELRTPVANLKTRLYLLRRQPEKMTEHLDVIEQVIAKMQQLTEEMFDFTEIEHGVMLLEREDVFLQDMVAEVVSNYQAKAEQRSVVMECDLAPDPLKVFVDRKRFVQVITNLVSTALSHTRPGGSVSIRVTRDSLAPNRAVLQVQDNGLGLTPDLLEKIFQPFSVAKHGDVGGTALGLTITKEIVELHDGEITAKSEAGQGTLFTVRLPLVI